MLYEKWEEDEDLMIGHVKDVYKGDWGNWTASTLPAGLPSTNNGIEGVNLNFKTDGTFRMRSDFATFSENTSAWVHKKSTNDSGFPDSPLIRVATWQLAYLALETTFPFQIREDAVLRISGVKEPPASTRLNWLVPSQKLVNNLSAPTLGAKKMQVLTGAAKYLKLLEKPSIATSFDSISKMMSSFYRLEPLYPGRGIIHFSCSCPEYAKRAACHHALAQGIKGTLVDIPLDRSFQTLGKKKRGKGRIAKAAPALSRQPQDGAQASGASGFASSDHPDAACCLCGDTKSRKPNLIIFCDGCDEGYHQKCLVPTLAKIPDGEWYCSDECSHLAAAADAQEEAEQEAD